MEDNEQYTKLKSYMKTEYGITEKNIDAKLAELKNEYYSKVRRSGDGELTSPAVSG